MLQDFLRDGGESACLAIDYLMAASIISEVPVEYIELTALTGLYGAYVSGKGIETDFYVKNPKALMESIDSKHIYNVEKRDITSLKDLLNVEFAAVRFDRFDSEGKLHSHWVLTSKGVISYDSLDSSLCRKYGKPTTARIITYKEK